MQKEINPKKIKALALDLDGTALLPDASLGERTIQCLKQLMERGIQVIFCTGRAIEGAERFRAAIGAEGPMVFFNGAEVVDVPVGNMLSATLVDTEVVDFGVDLARSLGVHYQIYLPAGAASGNGANKWEALVIDKPTPEAEMYQRHTGITPVVKDLKTAIAVPGLAGCVKAMFITDPSRHDEIRQKMLDRFGSRIYIARTFPTFLEIMNAGVSKGAGLRTAMQHRGLKREEVIALGDEENDLLMFNVAGYSAAPANAREKVKEAADRVFGSNTEEGLAVFLEELFKIG
ncbi:MAG: Cof-type HAD-IIB family hydrolase [Treponema sp.]|jgi:Cof subfamily protein (haloacid dehalogenase superfamily)|nr:Cof-type HAD-IIB family hydrolase [Treponema sp.]